MTSDSAVRALYVQFIGDGPCFQQFIITIIISLFAHRHRADDILDSSNNATCSVSKAFLNVSASDLQLLTIPTGLEKAASAARVKPPFVRSLSVAVGYSNLPGYSELARSMHARVAKTYHIDIL